jgi:hypothetical protein
VHRKIPMDKFLKHVIEVDSPDFGGRPREESTIEVLCQEYRRQMIDLELG